MKKPKITKLVLTYKNSDINSWVLDDNDIPIPKNFIKDKQIINLAPKYIGGNHKHSRTEWFIGTGDLSFVWLDEDGKKHKEKMNHDGDLFLIEVPPYLSHAVVNESDEKYAILFEYADGKLEDTESVKVL